MGSGDERAFGLQGRRRRGRPGSRSGCGELASLQENVSLSSKMCPGLIRLRQVVRKRREETQDLPVQAGPEGFGQTEKLNLTPKSISGVMFT